MITVRGVDNDDLSALLTAYRVADEAAEAAYAALRRAAQAETTAWNEHADLKAVANDLAAAIADYHKRKAHLR